MMMKVSRFNYKATLTDFNIVKTKMRLMDMYTRYFYSSIMSMCEIKGLPDSMPEDDVKFIIFNNGYGTMGRADDGNVYLFGDEGLGGEPDAYYKPTLSVVANAGLNFNKTFKIDEDCVIVKCTSMYTGFRDIINLYASLLATLDISMYWVSIGTRQQKFFESSNSDITKSLNEVFDSLENGDKLKAIAGKPLFDFLKTQDVNQASTTTSNIKALIEAKQYVKSSFFMMVGINANYNMKRESLNENEIDADIFTLIPHIDNVFDTIEADLEKSNKMFNLSISLERKSSWRKIEQEIDNRETEEELQIDALENQADEPDTNNEPNNEPDNNEPDNDASDPDNKEDDIDDKTKDN